MDNGKENGNYRDSIAVHIEIIGGVLGFYIAIQGLKR